MILVPLMIATVTTFGLFPTEREMPLIEDMTVKEVKITVHSENIPTEYDEPETIYDVLSPNEIDILSRIVEAECTDQSIEAKMNVANVIINRMNSDEFPDTVEDVVFQKVSGYYQFTPIADKRYWSVKVSKETIEAIEKVYQQEDTTNGALYFCNKERSRTKNKNWMERNLEYVLTDDANHSFYR